MAVPIADDDMVILIVEDKEILVGRDEKIKMPTAVLIKEEPLDPSGEPAVEEVLQTVAKHGEYIEIKVEEEDDYEVEYLEDEFNVEQSAYESDNKKSGEEYKDNKGRQQHPKSFVRQLRNLYPELKKSPKLLVEHLANVMNDLKPPSPPSDFCKVKQEGKDCKFECSICQEVVDTLSIAKRHYQNCHGPRMYLCFACGADFRRQTNLYKHERRCLAPDAVVVLKARGHYLGRKGRGRPFLTRHKFYRFNNNRTNNPPTRLYCSQCPASFAHRDNLEAHENSHSGVRPYRCHACPAAYTSDTGLKRHLPIHGKDLFTCDHCGRSFKLKPALKSHLDTHRTLRKYPCEHCPRRFAQKTALRHHRNRTHLNLPAACGCPVCPKRYARMSHVKDHMKRVHGLAMITRKMYFKALPTMKDLSMEEAKIVLKSDLNELSPQEEETVPKKIQRKRPPKQNVYQILQNSSVKDEQDDQKMYEIVLNKEENGAVMDEFLKFIQSKVEPGKMIRIQNAEAGMNETKVEVLSVDD